MEPTLKDPNIYPGVCTGRGDDPYKPHVFTPWRTSTMIHIAEDGTRQERVSIVSVYVCRYCGGKWMPERGYTLEETKAVDVEAFRTEWRREDARRAAAGED